MLQALRDATKSNLMRAFLLILVVGFAMWGIGDIFRASPNDQDAIRVGDINVSAIETATIFDQARRLYYPDLNNNEAIAQGLMNQVMGELVSRSLFEAEAARLGLVVTDEMAKNAIRRNPLFQDDAGNFNALLLRDILARRGIGEAQLLAEIGYAERRNQLVASIASGVRYAPPLAESMAAWLAQRRQVRYAELAIVPDNVPDPDDTSLGVWYDDNQDIFAVPIQREVTAVVLTPEHYLGAVRVRESDLRAGYEARIDDYVLPERRDFLQMVLPDLTAAEAVLTRLKGGEDFAEIALEIGGDSIDDIRFTQVERGALLDNLGDAIFAGALGVIADAIETPFGVYVVELIAVHPAETTSFEEARAGLAAEMQNESAINMVYDSITIFEEAQAGGATLEEAAEIAKARVVMLPNVGRNAPPDTDGQDADDIATSTAFRGAVWQQPIGVDSGLIADENNTYFALRVDSETPQRTRRLDEVRSQAIAAWKMETAISRTRKQAESIIAANDFAGAVKDAGATLIASPPFLQSGSGFDHEESSLIAAASFAIAKGDRTIVESGGATMIVLKLEEITEGDAEALALRQAQLLGEFASHLAADTEEAITRGLATIHSIDANPNAALRLLIGNVQ